MILYSKFSYGSQFSEEKNGLEIRSLVPEIFKKYKRSIFFETPCRSYLYSSMFDCLLNISATEKQIYKPFFSSENWDPYENFEYSTISMQI